MTVPSSLAETLAADLPASVAELPRPVSDRLAEQVRAARERQVVLVEESVQAALQGVPLAVRGVVKKAVLG